MRSARRGASVLVEYVLTAYMMSASEEARMILRANVAWIEVWLSLVYSNMHVILVLRYAEHMVGIITYLEGKWCGKSKYVS